MRPFAKLLWKLVILLFLLITCCCFFIFFVLVNAIEYHRNAAALHATQYFNRLSRTTPFMPQFTKARRVLEENSYTLRS